MEVTVLHSAYEKKPKTQRGVGLMLKEVAVGLDFCSLAFSIIVGGNETVQQVNVEHYMG